MNRNDIVKLTDLLEGDRFYKAGDGKKNAMAVRKIQYNNNGSVKAVTICPSHEYEHPFKVSFPTINKPEEYTAVFLRHNIDIA